MYDVLKMLDLFTPPPSPCIGVLEAAFKQQTTYLILGYLLPRRHIRMVPCAARRTAGRALRRWAAGPRCSRSSSRGASPAREKRGLFIIANSDSL